MFCKRICYPQRAWVKISNYELKPPVGSHLGTLTLSGQDVVTFIVLTAAPIGLTLVCVGLRGIFAHQEYLGIGWQM